MPTASPPVDLVYTTAPTVALPSSSIKDYWKLTKPGVLMLVVFTASIGLLTAPGALHPVQIFACILAIAMGSAGGGAINMWYDHQLDARMERTKNRPVPSGRVAPEDALFFGCVLAVCSVLLMAVASNVNAAGLLAFAVFFYSVIYTMGLKRRTPQNIVIGGAAGAFPPVIGWLASSNQATLEPWLLFTIIFLWTPPHFWALALYRCEDYAKNSIPMLPAVKGERYTLNQIAIYSVLLIMTGFLPFIMGYSGLLYLLTACLLNGLWLFHLWRLYRQPSKPFAMKLFGFSIIYLFLLFAGYGLDHLFFPI